MADKIDRDRFIAMLRERLPEVHSQIDDCCEGLLHLEMGTLARVTQAAIDDHDQETVRRHFAFVDELWGAADADVANAIGVSYLEHLRFEGRKAGPMNAREMLSPRLQRALKELEEGWERLLGGGGSA